VKRNTLFIVICLIAAATLIALSAFSGRFEINKLKQRLDSVTEEARTSLASLSSQNEALATSNVALKTQRDLLKNDAAFKTSEINMLIAERATRDAIIADLRHQMQTGPIADVLTTTRDILATQEITLSTDNTRAEFSLAAFRKNGVVLVEWREFTLKTIPSLKEEVQLNLSLTATLSAALNTAEQEIANQDTIITIDTAKFIDYERIIAEHVAFNAEHVAFNKAKKRSALKRDAALAVISFALGFISHK